MCRKMMLLISVVAFLAVGDVTLAFTDMNVDICYVIDGAPDPCTHKPGWIPFAGWTDSDRHDAKFLTDLGGTGINVGIGIGHEGDLSLGRDYDVQPGNQLVNTAVHYFSKTNGTPQDDVLLAFTELPPGEYWLYGYHRHQAGKPPMLRVDVNCIYREGKFGADPNCIYYDPCGVVQIHDEDTNGMDVNVGIAGDIDYDANFMPSSLVKFYTDGTGVLVTYVASENDWAVLNAFILRVPPIPIAIKPDPQSDAVGVMPDANLSWVPGAYVVTHNVYFGTDFNDVNEATTASGVYQGDTVIIDDNDVNDIRAVWDPPGNLPWGQTYYWRIDEVNDACGVPFRSSIWNFTVHDGKAINPNPEDGRWSIETESPFLFWSTSAGLPEASHDIYFGTDFNDVNDADTTSAAFKVTRIPGEPYYIPPEDFNAFSHYYWRVDEDYATLADVKGDVFHFVTVGGVLMHHKFDGVKDDPVGNLDDPNFVTDSTGNTTFEHNGDVYNLTYGQSNPLINSGNTSADFDQQDQQAALIRDVAGQDILDLSGYEYTIEMWIKRNSHEHGGSEDDDFEGSLFRKFDRSYAVGIGDDNALRFRHAGDSVLASPENAIEMGLWYHVAAVFDSSDGVAPQKLYIDGILVDSGGTTARNTKDDDDPATIGYLQMWRTSFKNRDYFDGLIDELRVTDIALGPYDFLLRGDPNLAWRPQPGNGASEVARNTELSWSPGEAAGFHDVYFGTDYEKVRDANTAVDLGVYQVRQNLGDTSYSPDGILDLSMTYYWRIDEINDANDDSPWTGNIWSFLTAEYVVIEDFEDYNDTENVLYDSWEDGVTNLISSSVIWLATEPNVHGGEQAMEFLYENQKDWWSGHYWSEVVYEYNDPCDWEDYGVKVFTLFFYGQSGNAAGPTEQMFVSLEDTNSRTAVYYDGDANDVQVEDWQEWNIALSEFTDVDMNEITKMYIGFGNQESQPTPGGTGTVFFDDLRVYPPKCVPEYAPPADISGNCIVDYLDILILGEEWLKADKTLSATAPPTGPIGHWKLDEASGTTIIDDGSGGNNGELEGDYDRVAGHVGSGAVNFRGGRGLVPDAAVLRPENAVSVCAWVISDDDQSSARIVVKGADDKESYELEADEFSDILFAIREDSNTDSYPRFDVNDDGLNQDEWVHLAGTYDGTWMSLYINGELVADANYASGVTMLSQDPNGLAIGDQADDDADNPFNGKIDDVRVYGYALSASEVAHVATGGTGILAVESIANLYNLEDLGDRSVNMRDFAVIAESWLEEVLWPL